MEASQDRVEEISKIEKRFIQDKEEETTQTREEDIFKKVEEAIQDKEEENLTAKLVIIN